jgi:hypothetical protein
VNKNISEKKKNDEDTACLATQLVDSIHLVPEVLDGFTPSPYPLRERTLDPVKFYNDLIMQVNLCYRGCFVELLLPGTNLLIGRTADLTAAYRNAFNACASQQKTPIGGCK